MRGKGQSQNTFQRIMASSIRALCKARDAYVRSITNCGYSMSYGNPMDDAGRFSALPRSYSAASSRSENSEDFTELMRAASARTLANRIDMDLIMKQQQHQANKASTNGLPKSTSVGMARIEEEPYDSGEAAVPVVFADSYPRSKSYAVGKRNSVL